MTRSSVRIKRFGEFVSIPFHCFSVKILCMYSVISIVKLFNNQFLFMLAEIKFQRQEVSSAFFS